MSSKRPLRQVLLELELATDIQIAEALRIQRERGGRFARILVELGHVREEDMLLALGAQARMELVDLDHVGVPDDLLSRIPATIARAYHIVPVRGTSDRLTIALSDPLAIEVLGDLRAILGCELEGVVAGEAAITRALDRYYPELRGGTEGLAREVARMADQGGGRPPHGKTAQFQNLVEAWIDQVLLWSQAQQATDISFELEGTQCRVLYRVEGVSRPVGVPDAGVGTHVMARLREMAQLSDEDPLGSMGQLERAFGEDRVRYRATLERVGSVERITLHRLRARVPVAATPPGDLMQATAEAAPPECEGRNETRLTGFLFGVLSEAEMDENERHIRRCAACRLRLQRVRERLALLTDWAPPEPSPRMTQSLLSKAASWKRRARWVRLGLVLLVPIFCGFLLWVAYRIAENRMVRKDMAQVSRAIQRYRNDLGHYPRGTTADLFAALGHAENGKCYFTPRPDQLNSRGEWIDRWGNPMIYTCPGLHNPGLFDLLSLGRDGQDENGEGDDINNWE